MPALQRRDKKGVWACVVWRQLLPTKPHRSILLGPFFLSFPLYNANQPHPSLVNQLVQPCLFFFTSSFRKVLLPLSAMASPHYKPDRASANSAITKEGDKFIIKPYALDIVWGGDSRYWRKPAKPEDTAELLQVSWLEVTGSIDLDKLRTDKEYRVIFKVSLKTDAFGWADSPVYLMAKPGKAALHIWKKTDLSSNQAGELLIPSDLKFKVPDKVNAGEKLQFGMYEIWKGRWKGGLTIHEVIVEPC